MKAAYLWCALCLGVLIAFAAGCGDDDNSVKPDPDPDPYLPRSSPANCLENLITAYVERDPEGFLELFAEDFTFVFSPDDVVQDPTIPPQWGLVDEHFATEGMFTSDRVDRIELQFTQSVADTSGHEFPDTWKVMVTEIELRVHMRTGGGENLLLVVTNGFGSFYFREYPDETASDGQPLWRIWRWEDQPLGLKGQGGERASLIAGMSWGRIKNLFRPDDLQTGACCLAGDYCLIVTEVDCASRDGVWQGVGAICDPNPCEPVNTPPVACFGYSPRSGQVDTVFEFDAGCSSDREDPVDSLEVRWDWEDDGVWDTRWTTTKVAEHSFDTPGEKTVRLEVRDTGGLTAETTNIVTVHPPEPTM